jgi:hypothetical protein
MTFNSQIATTREQSQRLLALGVKPGTADMYLEKSQLPEAGNYYLHSLTRDIDPEHWFAARMNRDIIPAWSLSRLIEMLPVEVPDPKSGFRPHHPELIKHELGYNLSIRRSTADCLVGTHIENDPIECCVSMIQWLIKHKCFDKEYLK